MQEEYLFRDKIRCTIIETKGDVALVSFINEELYTCEESEWANWLFVGANIDGIEQDPEPEPIRFRMSERSMYVKLKDLKIKTI